MLSKSTLLLYYKRPEIQQEIIANAENREVAVKFGDQGFGKRPDILKYPNDVLELAKNGATSFHASEETWKNPLVLDPMLKRNDLDDLRIGFDLILDIDCEYWDYSKLTADLLVKALKSQGINSISCKFSGNKGFHIGVPYEAFPKFVNDKEVRVLFPEAPRKIAAYLATLIKWPLAKKMLEKDDINEIAKKTGKEFSELVKNNEFDPFAIIDIDTILISSRHMYRMPYSLHEKSGLVSLPIDPDKVLGFEKVLATPENATVYPRRFLDKSNVKDNEARQLFLQALDFMLTHKSEKEEKEFTAEEIKDAIPEEFFPPCIKKILEGLEDGRKRGLFVLFNFLSSAGWSYDQIEKRIAEWNKKNKEPLREVYILSHMRYNKRLKKSVLPPNCDNKAYYKDFNICAPDNLCEKIKNPVNYARRKVKFLNKEEKKPQREKLTEEQKEMRRKHRENAKKKEV